MPPESLVDAEFDEGRVHEAPGNEGASFERSYGRAALVAWPSAVTAEVVLGGARRDCIAWVDAGGQDVTWSQMVATERQVLKALICGLRESADRRFWDLANRRDEREALVPASQRWGDPALLKECVDEVVATGRAQRASSDSILRELTYSGSFTSTTGSWCISSSGTNVMRTPQPL